jgi:hypothetical protein
MTAATWIAILILGPGSVAVFVLFLRDAREILRNPGDRPSDAGKTGTQLD